MKAIVMLVALVGSSGCPQKPSTPALPPSVTDPASLSTRTMLLLGSKGASREVGGRALSVSTTVNSLREFNGKFVAALSFASTIDGRSAPALGSGSIGIGETRDEAIKVALDEWVMQYGSTVIFALMGPERWDGGKDERPAPLFADGIIAYASPQGFRGMAPHELRAGDFPESFIKHVSPLLKPVVASREGLHAVTLMLAFDEGAFSDGECRVDAEVSPALLALVKAYPWPKMTGSFMFKQYFVVVAGQRPK